jgi:hypothetical protein
MRKASVPNLHQEWQREVEICAQERRSAANRGASSLELKRLERIHNLRVDVAYARFKTAQDAELLRRHFRRPIADSHGSALPE